MLGGVGDDGYSLKFYRNDVSYINTKPAPPAGLQSDVQAGNLVLQWDKSLDNETAQKGLTYNVFLWSENRGF